MDLPPAPQPAYDPPAPGRRRAPRPPRRRPRTRDVALVVAAAAVALAARGHPGQWLLGLPADALGGFQSDYAFLDMVDDDTPVAWNNCKAIHYVVNPQGAPADWEQLVKEGLAEINAASGYVFVLDGTTTDRAFTAGRWKGNPVLVMWGVRREYRTLGEGTAGWGGPIAYDDGTGPEYGSGSIMFDALYFDRLERTGARDAARMVVEHEWMHVLGLDHTGDRHQVMGTSGRRDGVDALGDGDIAGLKALRAVPCPGTTAGTTTGTTAG